MSLAPPRIIVSKRKRVVAKAKAIVAERKPIARIAIAASALLAAIASVGYTAVSKAESAEARARRAIPTVVSGTAGLRETPSGAHERWSHATVVITLDASLDAMDPGAKDAVRAAFGSWIAGASLPPLTFDSSKASTAPKHDGLSVISYGPITIAGHENDVAATIGYEDPESGLVVEADTVFNSAYQFVVLPPLDAKGHEEKESSAVACGRAYDVQNVATHEAGHFFGLGEDVTDPTTTMYLRSDFCQTHKRDLTESDRAVITSLYSEPVTSASRGCAVARVGMP